MQRIGIVKGNVVLLEEGVHFPDVIRVVATVEQEEQIDEAEVTSTELAQRHAITVHMKAFSERLAYRYVNLGELVLEGRQELEDHA